MAHQGPHSKGFLSSRKLELSIVRTDGRAETIVLEPEDEHQFLIGRDRGCHITIADRSVSQRHAMLVFSEKGHWKIKDLGSTNGTFLNGKPIDVNGSELDSGDKISIGIQELYVQKHPLKK